jgi:hypothetical protein
MRRRSKYRFALPQFRDRDAERDVLSDLCQSVEVMQSKGGSA